MATPEREAAREGEGVRLAPGYRLVRTLASGSRAEVLLVQPEDGGAPLVWKVLRPEVTVNPEALGRFFDEGGVLQRLHHPHVVRSLGSGRLADGRYFVATEHLEGQNLAEHLCRAGPLTGDQAVQLFIPICEALAYLHEHGVCHRALRPSHIFLAGGLERFDPRLIDFGMALFTGTRSYETIPGAAIPRFEYTAPELYAGHKADAQTDLYALGVVLYEALAGRPPFVGVALDRALRGQSADPPAPLPAHARHLERLVARCIAPRRSERYQSASELHEALVEYGLLPTPLSQGGATPASADQKLGDRLGAYELVAILADGAHGRVFLGRDTATQEAVAVKVLAPEHTLHRQRMDELVQVARALGELRHPSLAQVHAVGDERNAADGRRVFLAMELLDGVTLRSRARSGPLPLARAVRLLRQLCEGLDAAHRAGVFHGRVNPDSVLVVASDGEEQAKLVDFECARIESDEGAGALVVSSAARAVYLAPEQLLRGVADARADVYAMGAVLYELLAGSPPYALASPLALTDQIRSAPPLPLPKRTVWQEPIPARLRAVILRCLEKAPSDRWQTVAALRAALEPFEKAPRARSGRSPTSDVGRGWAGVVAATLGVAAVAALGVTQAARIGSLGAQGGWGEPGALVLRATTHAAPQPSLASPVESTVKSTVELPVESPVESPVDLGQLEAAACTSRPGHP